LSYSCAVHHHNLHSFPTRRSSDLKCCSTPARQTSNRTTGEATSRWKRAGDTTAGGRASIRALRCLISSHAPGQQQRFEPFFCRRSEEHTSELQSRSDLVCRLLLEK